MNQNSTLQNLKSFRAFFKDNLGIFMLIDGDSGQILDVSKGALLFYGYVYEEFVQLNISDVNQYSKEEVEIEIQNSIKARKNYFVFIHQLYDGTVKKVSVNSYPVVVDEKTYLLTHITEYIKKENETLNERISDLVELSDDSICILDTTDILKSKIIYANKAFKKMLKIDLENDRTLLFRDVFYTSAIEEMDDHRIFEGPFVIQLNSVADHYANVTFTAIRFHGEKYIQLILTPLIISPNRDIYLEKNYNASIFKVFKSYIGHLLYIDIILEEPLMNTLNQMKHCCLEKISKLFEQRTLNYVVSVTNHSIAIFSTLEMTDLLIIANSFLSSVDCANKESLTPKFRVVLSKWGSIEDQLRQDVKETLESFGEYEYNTVHTSNRKGEYLRIIDVKNDIENGVNRNEFELYFQSIVNISNRDIVGIEILLRWEHPKHGMIMPTEFIQYAELTGYIREIDLWVIENSLRYVEEHQPLFKGKSIHINVSIKSLPSNSFFELLKKYTHVIKYNKIVLEITEESNIELSDEIFERLMKMGVELAIDDFGTGYSSFERIRKAGIKYIKIDKSLIRRITTHPDDVIILKTLITMCRNLDIEVIAEGVEIIEELEFLSARDCYHIQGFLFDKPHALPLFEQREKVLKNEIAEIVQSISDRSGTEKSFYKKGQIITQQITYEGQIINQNPMLARQLRCDAEKMSALNFSDLVQLEQREYFERLLSEVTNNDMSHSMSLKLVTAKNKEFDVVIAIRKTKKSDTLDVYIEFIDDVEEEKQALLGLSHSYVQSFEEAPSSMIILSEDFRVIKWNRSSQYIFGYDVKEVIDHNLLKLISSDNQRANFSIMLNKALKNGFVEMVIENDRRDGKTIICRWHVKIIFDELNKSHIYICIVNDITDSIKKEKERMKITKALDQSKSIIIMTDVHGNIEYVNEMFTTVTGYEFKEVIGKHTRILSSKEQNENFYKELWLTITHGDLWKGEFHNKTKDGSLYWCQTSIYPIKESGVITGYLGIQVDTTKEKELLDMNGALKDRLFEQDRVASLGMLTSGIMHEINNPLGYIQSNVKYLLEEFGRYDQMNEDERGDFIEAIQDIDTGVTQIRKIADGLKRYILNVMSMKLKRLTY